MSWGSLFAPLPSAALFRCDDVEPPSAAVLRAGARFVGTAKLPVVRRFAVNLLEALVLIDQVQCVFGKLICQITSV